MPSSTTNRKLQITISQTTAALLAVGLLATVAHGQTSSLWHRPVIFRPASMQQPAAPGTPQPGGRQAVNAAQPAQPAQPAGRETLPAPSVFPGVQPPPRGMISGTRSYIPVQPVRKLKQYDIISVRVDELARMQQEGDMERRKNAQYDAILQDWVFLDGLSVRPSPQSDGDPRIRGSINQLYRAEGSIETRESLAFNIAATVREVRPNGNLVLEAHRIIKNNEESWEYSLSGICRAEDVGPDNVVLSRDIVNLRVDKRERGAVPDSYRRGWLMRIYDLLHAF